MKKIYGSLSAGISEQEKAHYALAREAARESFVLLKNDGALPLKNKKIALYGMGARKTVAGGTGSGATEPRYSVSIEQGLVNAGYTITTQAYLDDYDAECSAAYKGWHDMVEENIAAIQDPMQAIYMALSFIYQYPVGRLILDADVAASDTDTAIYVVMRQAGEGQDRKLEKGDFLLTDIERANLEFLAKAYAHTILVINIGGMIDLTFLDEIPGIHAVVFYVQGGLEGGNALADLLSGSHSFSGKLADTWPMRYEDVPVGELYSYLSGDLSHADYTEGIYVGYRYYDSFEVQPRYPFGYGLSYTTFAIQATSVRVDGTEVIAEVRVTNTGAAHSGKEVVQAYLSAPQAQRKMAYQSLVAFGKTGELQPGESEKLILRFDLSSAASYDETTARRVLDAGDYALRIGASSRDTTLAAVLQLPGDVITEQCRSACAPAVPLVELEVSVVSTSNTAAPDTAPRLIVDPTRFTTKVHDYAEPQVLETLQVKAMLDSLTLEEMAELVRGGDLQTTPKGTHPLLGSGGKTALTLLHKGLSNIIITDGPAGLNFTQHARITPEGELKPALVPEKYNWGAFGAMMGKSMTALEGTDVYFYATAWPVEALLAQSWNITLLERIGEAVGAEMKAFGITLWLAPGMNIHRNPLCGRTFEYFSEDPLLTGKMAAAITRGVQRFGGIGTTIKHFCCNDQEDNRSRSSSNVNERALREIHLKGFEIAVNESQPWSVMSSYNKLNGVYTANRHDLLIDILRCEWGFNGMVMTDWGSCDNGQGDPALCVPAGNDLIMPGNDENKQAILVALASGKMTPEALRRCAARVLKVIYDSDFYAENTEMFETVSQP